MARADLRQILADWWLLKGKLVVRNSGAAAAAAAAVGPLREEVPSVPSEEGERLVEAVVVGVVALPVVLGKALVKLLQEQVGHWRGSVSSVALRDLRSQCLREKTGMSKKAQ